jgi:putative SOS response-associated peptidase YedK
MIERYTLTSLDGIEALGGAAGAAAPDGRPRFNIAPLQIAPIATADGLVAARWGLLPPWRGHGGKRDPHILHAPASLIEATPILRNAFKSRRCLVIADGFFVWHRGGKKPQPLWIHPPPDPARPGARSRVAVFAGLAATHRDDNQPSFAIVVGPASPLVAPFAPTMPVVVPAESRAAWLRGPRERAAEVLAGAAAATGPAGWRAEPVSTWVNSIEHDDARCIEPLGNPAQGELF